MTEFISEIKTIPYDNGVVYGVLSDLNKLKQFKDQIPQDKMKDFTFDSDSCSFRVDPVGLVKFKIVEREPVKLIKFKSENLPFEVILWLQLVGKAPLDTKMKLTVKAELNPFIKGMVSKPLKEALDKMADVLSQLPYEKL